MGRYVASKWKKTAVLLKNRQLSSYVPTTVQMTEASLSKMLDQYTLVYVKPVSGTFGKGVMRVEKADGRYSCHLGTTPKSFGTYPLLYQYVRKIANGRPYLVQRGIQLLKYKGKRFDLRIMVQLNPNKQWETTGYVGRVAAAGKIVTNYHSGGTLKPVETLLAPYTGNGERLGSTLDHLKRLGEQAAGAMKEHFPGVLEIGLDIAMDESLRPWILEINTRPDPYVYRKLPDKAMAEKVLRFHRSYTS